MSCDIHLYVERRTDKKNSDSGADQWEHVPGCHWYESRGRFAALEEQYRKEPTTARAEYLERLRPELSDLPDFDPGRNYYLFTVLAGVRREGHEVLPVLLDEMRREQRELPPPEQWGNKLCTRGLPDYDDGVMSDYVKARVFDIGQDGHSFNWLTLRQLQEYDWDQASTEEGVVSVQQYIQLKETGAPSSWSRSISGGSIMHISNEEMDRYIAAGCPADGKQRHTHAIWSRTPRQRCQDFVERIMPELAKLDPNPDNVRIVMWFDN